MEPSTPETITHRDEKIAAPMALAIPLIAIAGGIAGGVGVIAVMAALTIIIALVFVDRWR
ncbi:MAG: hypothetical protein PVSMB7_15760 [Chloroflexota bacterium]